MRRTTNCPIDRCNGAPPSRDASVSAYPNGVEAERLGDRGGRELVERHHGVIQALLARFGGVEVDASGDDARRSERCAVGAVSAPTRTVVASARWSARHGEYPACTSRRRFWVSVPFPSAHPAMGGDYPAEGLCDTLVRPVAVAVSSSPLAGFITTRRPVPPSGPVD